MEFVAPFESVHRYVVHLPPAFVLDGLPSSRTIRSKWGVFTVKVKPTPSHPSPSQGEDGVGVRVVDFEFTMRLERPRVEVADFDEFRLFHEDVNRHYRVWLTLKPVQSLADAPLLEAVLALVPEDAANAAALAKLYEINDKADDARRVLRRALHFAPDDPELWRLVVKAAKGAADEEDAQRELVRRFPDEAKHTIDLGAILINRGKQEEARKLLEPLTKTAPPGDRALAHYQLGAASTAGTS